MRDYLDSLKVKETTAFLSTPPAGKFNFQIYFTFDTEGEAKEFSKQCNDHNSYSKEKTWIYFGIELDHKKSHHVATVDSLSWERDTYLVFNRDEESGSEE